MPPTGRDVALRALLRPYAGRALPDTDALLGRARSALRQAGEHASMSTARRLIEEARREHTGPEPEPAAKMGMRALLGCHIDAAPSDPLAVRMMLRKEKAAGRRRPARG